MEGSRNHLPVCTAVACAASAAQQNQALAYMGELLPRAQYAISRPYAAILLQQILELCSIPTQAEAGTYSSAAKGMAYRVGSGRVRHLRIQGVWIQERDRTKDLVVTKLDMEFNRAGVGTNYLDGITH